jgi:flagellar hook assembly protein FlgD
VRYSVPVAGQVSLRVCDVSGRLVRRLVEGEVPAGLHAVFWDGKDDAGRDALPGVYFYGLETAGQSQTRKGLLVRLIFDSFGLT